MKRSLWTIAVLASIFLLMSCSSGPATAPSASTISAAPASENPEQVITRLEHEWVTAIVKKDADAIGRLLADDFTGTTDDQIYSKADAIEDVKTGTHESLELDNIKVRIFGDTAVVTMGQTEKSRHGDADFSGHYLFTDVWAKKNGAWIAVASHGSRFR
jgi:ketosteroid isomerase-like protein